MSIEDAETIVCVVQPAIVAVKNGELTTSGRYNRIEAYIYPDNCPRGKYYDSAVELGCFACVQSRGIMPDGTIVRPGDGDTIE